MPVFSAQDRMDEKVHLESRIRLAKQDYQFDSFQDTLDSTLLKGRLIKLNRPGRQDSSRQGSIFHMVGSG